MKIDLMKKLTIIPAMSAVLMLSACGGSSGSSTPATAPPPPTAPPPVTQPPVDEQADYQNVIEGLISENVPGAVLLVETPTERFLGAAGVSDKETLLPMQVTDVMPTASAGKKMVSLLAIELANEGLLDLDDTIDTWLSATILSNLENSTDITLRQLLNHTSGIYNFVDVDDGDAYISLLLAEPEALKTDIDFVQLVYNESAYFQPGEGYEYSNTGYALVGLILDAVLGQHHSSELRNRYFDPLGMTSTFYRGIEIDRGSFISGYTSTDDGDIINTKPFLENAAQASAPVVSSVEDMTRFLTALIADESFVDNDVRNIMFGEQSLIAHSSGEKTGLGIDVATVNGHKVYAHAGLTFGYMSQSAYVKDENISITVFLNCGGEDLCTQSMDGLIELVLENEL